MLKWLFGRSDNQIGIEVGDGLILSGDGDLSLEVGDNLALNLKDSSISLTLDLDGDD